MSSQRRKRKYSLTEEVIIPSASRGAQRPLAVANERPAENARTLKRSTVTYYPPAFDRAPIPGDALGDYNPLVDDFDDFDFSPIPSNEEVERYLAKHDLEDEAGDEQVDDKVRKFATLEHDSTLRAWSLEVDRYLDEIIRLDGLRGASPDRCPRCPASTLSVPRYRCMDCFSGQLLCSDCCLHAHQEHPFHRVNEWNGTFFRRTTLQAVGQVIQLGHPFGEACPAPTPGPRACLVVHTNGFHPVTLQFCQCASVAVAGDRTEQLLRAELYGASLTDPTTFCTLRVLEAFHIQTLQSKMTAYDFYMSLQHMTDVTGISRQYDRLKPFLRVVREWRYIKLLKRSGRGHINNGVKESTPGDLCLRCPACPRPGVNLPENWESVSDDLRYLYMLILAIDANFRLKRRAVSNDARDPGLMSGRGYFVPDGDYRTHVLRYADQEDISTCTGFAAMAHANTKFNKGYATTGVGLVLCARHGFILPHGVGDLQKGERFCNMDYIAMSSLLLFGDRCDTVFSYDIACQWEIYLRRRVMDEAFPRHLRLELPVGRQLRFAIPKYHFWGHKGEDHNKYSLNLMSGVGRTDGEEVERNWWRHDATAASTREMGPGSRHDTLEDHFNWSNFTRLIGLGKLLTKRLKTAVLGFSQHTHLLDDFSTGIPSEHIKSWTDQVVAYEADNSLPDPYYVAPSGLTEAEIKLQLADEEDRDAATGKPVLHAITPSSMLVELLEIEEQQRRFKQKYPVVTKELVNLVVDIYDRRAGIRRRVQTVRDVQAIYMPCVPQMVALELPRISAALDRKSKEQSRQPPRSSTSSGAAKTAATPVPPEHIPLFLPSQVPASAREGLVAGVCAMESRLREGQMRNALDKLLIHLHIRSRLVSFKARQVRHQRENMKAHAQLDANEVKIKHFKLKYQAARAAKLALDGPGAWETEWPVLKDADVRGLRDSEPQVEAETSNRQRITEGKRTLSWIWTRAGVRDSGLEASTVGGMTEALRGEWLRARARPLRYREEIGHIREERRRTVVTLEKVALDWEARGAAREVSCPLLREGLRAYAAEQASIQRGFSAHFQRLWQAPIKNVTTETGPVDEGRELDGDLNGGVLYAFAGDDSDDEDGRLAGVERDED
ncbi:CxC2 domain-containing protein [Phanerochaete sordida]|uniref:CxC2 domain-containing protein n=1 Tax=Phanerochaete sordida TaxID=48140 RepID=A0A9P3GNX2_9APHY|nr:CxC2 domain-containing protein [Phanerochaete sordida]